MSNINIKIAPVISVDDEYDSGRIKVQLFPDDQNKTFDQIPFVYPLLPKMINVMPKVNEAVVILLSESGESNSIRYYIGPIISQVPKLQQDLWRTGALSTMDDINNTPNIRHTNEADAIGAFADKEDIAIYGRKGCDIILKENDIRIRSGARVDANNTIGKAFNVTNPAYIKLKYSETPTIATIAKTNKETTYQSTATMVADHINLISTNSDVHFNVTDKNEMITDEELKNIIEKAHVLPYGDVLVDFLNYFLLMFKYHTHAFPGLPTILPASNRTFFSEATKMLNNMLSKNVRIN